MEELPNGIDRILEYLAEMASGYGNNLKWNEVAKLKADLMNVPHRWLGVSVQSVSERCQDLGMRHEDVQEIQELVTKAQAGRRLIPQKSYRDFKFKPDVKVSAVAGTLGTSRSW
ncbi:hypothetical protein [Arthrobacter sp. AG258]|uniref:hypothetical protein n=1 Tax=Arthrobacter sp. AG258 TaxID=2183899 RepID=UPI00105E3369|nr:hypothetical protein [Arthrobacter sp. AG258]